MKFVMVLVSVLVECLVLPEGPCRLYVVFVHFLTVFHTYTHTA